MRLKSSNSGGYAPNGVTNNPNPGNCPPIMLPHLDLAIPAGGNEDGAEPKAETKTGP